MSGIRHVDKPAAAAMDAKKSSRKNQELKKDSSATRKRPKELR